LAKRPQERDFYFRTAIEALICVPIDDSVSNAPEALSVFRETRSLDISTEPRTGILQIANVSFLAKPQIP